jgi:hypothetical protein
MVLGVKLDYKPVGNPSMLLLLYHRSYSNSQSQSSTTTAGIAIRVINFAACELSAELHRQLHTVSELTQLQVECLDTLRIPSEVMLAGTDIAHKESDWDAVIDLRVLRQEALEALEEMREKE